MGRSRGATSRRRSVYRQVGRERWREGDTWDHTENAGREEQF
jgi:hypothetical protein